MLHLACGLALAGALGASAVAQTPVPLTAGAPIAVAPGPTAPPSATRPKIGLVLSGGGARGLTHIGVLKVLDELRIPIDFIAATSMGSIVGGFYTYGMTPAEMETMVTSLNWPTLFSDSVPRRDLDLRQKRDDARFPLPIEIGFRDGEFRGFKGAISGGNLELFLHNRTKYADNLPSFDRLPIPFRAVSTDMVTGKPYVFDSGPLYLAMRASMSVPGVFAPVEIGDRILGDGGLVDNLPIDIVRNMGAQVVIAVNIGTPLAGRDELSSVIGLTGQMINILTEQNVRQQLVTLKSGDILIAPELGKLSAADFNQGAEFIGKGETAARELAAELTALSLPPAAYAAYKARLPALVGGKEPVIDFVRVEGTHYANPEVLAAQLETPAGKPLDTTTLDTDIARIYGMGDFERVDYRLVEERNRTGLVLDVQEKSWGPNYLRFGLAFSTDFQGESSGGVLIGLKRAWLNSLGAEWLNEIELGRTTAGYTEFYQPVNIDRSVFGSAYAAIREEPKYVFQESRRVAEYSVLTETAGIDAGVKLGLAGELRVGPVIAYYRGSPTIAVQGFQSARQQDFGARALLRWDTLDDTFFPRHGVRVNLAAFYGSRSQSYGDTAIETRARVTRAELFTNAGIPLAADDFLNLAVRAGGTSLADPSLVNNFELGGFLNLSGLRTGQLNGSYVGLARAVYYHRLARIPYIGGNIFVGGSLEAGNAWTSRDAIGTDNLVKAGSVFFAADTFLGPFYFAWGRASGGNSSFYLFLGRPL